MSVPWSEERLDHPDLTNWSVRRLEEPPGWYLEGPCPKCGHLVKETWLDDLVRGIEVQSVQDGADTIIAMRCRCADPGSHGEHRPGCGRSWTVEIHP